MSRLLKIIGLFCRISSVVKGSFAKETYDFGEPTNRSHPIQRCVCVQREREREIQRARERGRNTKYCSFGFVHAMGWLWLVGSIRL